MSLNSRHVPIQPQCGVCGGIFMTDDNAVALMDPDLSGHFAHPRYGSGPSPNDEKYSCANAKCYSCELCPETATIHVFCLKLYLAQATPARGSIRSLWKVIVSRRPWTNSPAMLLPPEQDHRQIMAQASSFEGLCFLAQLPADIRDMIGKYLTSSLLAQVCAAEDVFRQLEYDFRRDDISLANVQTWTRGEVPVIVTNPPQTLIPTLICIDWKGIQSIQQQPFLDKSPEGYGSTKSRRFMTLKDTSQIKASFQFGPYSHTPLAREHPNVHGSILTKQMGSCRLTPPPTAFTTSNVPMPPDLAQSMCFATLEYTAWFTGIRFGSCFTLTFFMRDSRTFAIHAHTQAEPTAESTPKRIRPLYQSHLEWIYVPMASDQVLEFSIRYSTDIHMSRRGTKRDHGYTLHMEKAGSVSVGPFPEFRAPQEVACFNVSPDFNLIHTFPVSRGVEILGVYPQLSPHSSPFTPLPRPPDSFKYASFSSARLNEVTGVWVYDDEKGFCRGLILDYSGGYQRALGSCNVGIDSAILISDPALIRFAQISTAMGPQVRIISGETEEEYLWKTWPENGELEVWFTGEYMSMFVVEREPSPPLEKEPNIPETSI